MIDSFWVIGIDFCTSPFNKPFTIDKEFEYIQDTIENSIIRGDGIYTQKCHNFLESYLPAKRCLLTHSCTAALEMAAILADIKQGDEVIMPSYTFVSTANAFVLRGGVPVFLDIKPDTKKYQRTFDRISHNRENKSYRSRALCRCSV